MKTTLFITLFLTSLVSLASSKNINTLPTNLKNHLTISSIEVLDLTEQYSRNERSEKSILGSLNQVSATLDVIDVIVDQVINIGEKIWTVAEKGQPISSFSKQSASAVPLNTQSWTQLQNWKTPTSKVVGIAYKNVYGSEVVRFVYRIVLLYGGDVGGVGKYIGYASVEPLEMTTAYLYNFKAQAKVEQVYNMGTSANPVAGMILNVSWTVKTLLKTSTESHTYTLDGFGNIAVPN